MIERYEKEMRKIFETAPKEETEDPRPFGRAVETAVFPEDAPSVPQFQQREQSGEEMPLLPGNGQPMMPIQPQEIPSPDKTGSIMAEVTTARGAVPLAGVTVVIDRLDVNDPQGRQELIAVETTDADGRTKPVAVRTVSRDLSLSPGNADPFATFYISAKTEGFEPVRNRPVDVFADEMSILKIDLVPKPEKLGEGGIS